MTCKLRGIEPVIATIIILAVTIAVAVAVIGWITGLFGASVGGTEQLQIMPDSYINATNDTLLLHITNKGGDVTIDKIEIVGLGYDDTDRTISAGANTWIATNTASLKLADATSGTLYTVKVYTKNGNVFTATVQAKS